MDYKLKLYFAIDKLREVGFMDCEIAEFLYITTSQFNELVKEYDNEL